MLKLGCVSAACCGLVFVLLTRSHQASEARQLGVEVEGLPWKPLKWCSKKLGGKLHYEPAFEKWFSKERLVATCGTDGGGDTIATVLHGDKPGHVLFKVPKNLNAMGSSEVNLGDGINDDTVRFRVSAKPGDGYAFTGDLRNFCVHKVVVEAGPGHRLSSNFRLSLIPSGADTDDHGRTEWGGRVFPYWQSSGAMFFEDDKEQKAFLEDWRTILLRLSPAMLPPSLLPQAKAAAELLGNALHGAVWNPAEFDWEACTGVADTAAFVAQPALHSFAIDQLSALMEKQPHDMLLKAALDYVSPPALGAADSSASGGDSGHDRDERDDRGGDGPAARRSSQSEGAAAAPMEWTATAAAAEADVEAPPDAKRRRDGATSGKGKPAAGAAGGGSAVGATPPAKKPTRAAAGEARAAPDAARGAAPRGKKRPHEAAPPSPRAAKQPPAYPAGVQESPRRASGRIAALSPPAKVQEKAQR